MIFSLPSWRQVNPVCLRLHWAGDIAMTGRRSTALDRFALQQLLAEIEERIAHGERQIEEQRKLIAELKLKDPRGANHAKYLLSGLQLLQSDRRASRERLLKELNGRR